MLLVVNTTTTAITAARPYKAYMDGPELLEWLGHPFSSRTLANMRRDRVIPYFKTSPVGKKGGKILYDPIRVKEALDARMIQARTPGETR